MESGFTEGSPDGEILGAWAGALAAADARRQMRILLRMAVDGGCEQDRIEPAALNATACAGRRPCVGPGLRIGLTAGAESPPPAPAPASAAPRPTPPS